MSIKIFTNPLHLEKYRLENTRKTFHFSSTDFLVLLCAFTFLSFVSATDQSLWIDESITAWLASHPTFKELINTQFSFSGSEAQMPFYIWYVWGWAKIFGITELSLRMSNAPFLLLFLSTILWGSQLLFNDKWSWIIAAVSPFTVFYVNEARPYIAVIAFSSLATTCFLVYLMRSDNSNKALPWLCLLAAFLSCGMSMLSVFLIPVFIATLFITYKMNRDMWKVFLRDWLLPSLLLLPFFLILGGWFSWTLLQGFGGMREPPGLLNISFAAYEFLGFLGLGPPRNLIRSASTWSTFSQTPYIIPLFIGVIGWIVVTMSIVIRLWQNGINKSTGLMLCMLGIGISLFFLAAFLFHFRFWGRHLAQFFPIFLFIIIGLIGNGSQKHLIFTLHRVALWTLITIWLFSSMRLVFLATYGKDDYRLAVSCSVMAAGNKGTILWGANPTCGSYYGLYYTNGLMTKIYWPAEIPAILALNWNEVQIEYVFQTSPRPIVIAISKADLFDRFNTLRKAIAKYKAKLVGSPNAFMIYKLP
jgi:hypothetical protein